MIKEDLYTFVILNQFNIRSGLFGAVTHGLNAIFIGYS